MDRIDIEKKGISFKQIITGPAPVGRILNYIKLAGRGILKHSNGNRTINLVDNIGSAWATEYLIGLELAVLGREAVKGNYLELTEKGRKIYDIINNVQIKFDESQNITKVKKQIEINCPNLLDVFEGIFRDSTVFSILKIYLNENGYIFNRSEFLTKYFEDIKAIYDMSGNNRENTLKEVRTTMTTTGENRVPSLIQLCQLFEYVICEKNKLYFVEEQFQKEYVGEVIVYDKEILEKAVNQEDKIVKEVKDLEEKYGINGTILVEAIIRNSTVQKMFRSNLIAEFGSKCMVCGICNKELLIASHIKPSAESDIYEKIDNNNGLLLCANHDKLFDKHLITFDFSTGEIEISNKLSEEDKVKLGINDQIKLEETVMTDKRNLFLAEHNIVFHNKNGGNN